MSFSNFVDNNLNFMQALYMIQNVTLCFKLVGNNFENNIS